MQRSGLDEAQPATGRQRAVDDTDAGHDAAVLVELAVEDQAPAGQHRDRRLGRRDRRDHGVEQLRHAFAGLGRDAHDVVGRNAEDVLDLGGEAVGVGGREIDLVERGDDRQVVLEGEVAVGERLRLDPLGGVDDEHDAFTRRQRTADLVAEVDVAGRVDEVEDVVLPLDADVLRLDRDPPLAFEVHRVEVLLAHVAGLDRSGQLEDAIRERRLAVVDVGDDREVANIASQRFMPSLRSPATQAVAGRSSPSGSSLAPDNGFEHVECGPISRR